MPASMKLGVAAKSRAITAEAYRAAQRVRRAAACSARVQRERGVALGKHETVPIAIGRIDVCQWAGVEGREMSAIESAEPMWPTFARFDCSTTVLRTTSAILSASAIVVA